MKPWKYIITIIALCCVFTSTQAQQRKLSITFTTPFPASADSGQAETAYVIIRNVDTADYSGAYAFAYTVNGGTQQVSGSVSSGINYIPKFVTIAGGDSLQDTLSLVPNQPQFMAGPSVVVIWPIRDVGDLVTAVDTARFDIDIVHNNGTGISEITDGLLYYANGRIALYDSKNDLMQVRIWNNIGIEMYYTEGEHAQYIELPDLPAGIYIAEAILNDNKRIILKFVKPLH